MQSTASEACGGSGVSGRVCPMCMKPIIETSDVVEGQDAIFLRR